MSAYIGKHTYEELDEQSHFGNEVEYSLDLLRNLMSAAYPDNGRDALIADIHDAMNAFEFASKHYLAALDKITDGK